MQLRRVSAADSAIRASKPKGDRAGPVADLLTIYHEAQVADAVYAGARATYLAGQEKLPQGLSGLLPVVALNANSQTNDRDLQFRGAIPTTAAPYNSNSVNLTATQPLFRYQNWVTYQQAKAQVAQTDASYLQAAQDLAVRVAQAYLDVLLAQDNLALLGAQKAAFAEQLAQARRNFEVGTATITDANDAQARFDLSAAQEISAQNEVEIRRRVLQQIIGRVPPDLAPLRRNFAPAPPSPDRMDDWVEQARKSSLQVRVAEANVEIAVREVAKNRSGHLPTLDAVVGYTDTGTGSGVQGGPGLDASSRFIGLQLAVPIYQGGFVNSRVREARANAEKARHDLENTERTVALNTRAAFLGVANGVAQIRALETALLSSQSSLDSSRLGLDVGVRTQVDVLNATQQLITTRRDYAQATYSYIMNVLRLKANAGTLTDADIAYVNQWLQK